MLQYLSIAIPTKKCEEKRVFFESVDLKKNMRKLRFSCFKKPSILFTEQQKKSSHKFLGIATENTCAKFQIKLINTNFSWSF